MNFAAGNLKSVTQFIQLAVAPIFLLSAIAVTLTLFSNRLARIVDRGRWIDQNADAAHRQAELPVLMKRAQLIYIALTLGVLAAICIALLMALAFGGEVFGFNAATPVSLLFMSSLTAYTSALLLLLREVFLAIANFRLGIKGVPPA
jgi:hypothetical protein